MLMNRKTALTGRFKRNFFSALVKRISYIVFLLSRIMALRKLPKTPGPVFIVNRCKEDPKPQRGDIF